MTMMEQLMNKDEQKSEQMGVAFLCLSARECHRCYCALKQWMYHQLGMEEHRQYDADGVRVSPSAVKSDHDRTLLEESSSCARISTSSGLASLLVFLLF